MGSSCERQCRGFWPPIIPAPFSNILCFPPPNGQCPPQRLCLPPPPLTPGVQYPPSPPPLLLPSSPPPQSRLPRRCPSPTLVLLSSSDEEAEGEGETGKEVPSKGEAARSNASAREKANEQHVISNSDLPSELTGG